MDVRIVDPSSGKYLSVLQYQGGITPVVFSSRGQYLADLESRSLRVFKVASGKEVIRLDHVAADYGRGL
jgi:hypothetical protein